MSAPCKLLLPAALLALLAGACGDRKATVSTPPSPAQAAPEAAAVPPQAPAPQGQLIDRVVANVGTRMILYSELDARVDADKPASNKEADSLSCVELEDLLYQNLLLEQARIDSVVPDAKQVDAELEHRLRYFEQQIGGREALEKYYGKKEEQIKADFKEQVSDQLLAQQMQQKIVGDVRVTPREVEKFYRSIPKDSLPFINATVEFGRIVKFAKPTEEEDKRVRKALEDLRQRIVEGKIDFGTAAILYSKDPGSAAKGGELGMVPQGVMVSEFDAVALSLKEGEVSQVFKTEFGYHIMMIIERRGEQYNARHILMKLQVTDADQRSARAFLDSVATLVRDGKVTFAKAATELNDDEETKGSNGLVIEPSRNSPQWAIGDLDQKTFFVLDKLTIGTISEPQYFEEADGTKGYRIFMLTKRTDPHTMDLVRDYPLVSEAAEGKTKQRVVDQWVAEKLEGMYVRIIPDYASCPFNHKWIGTQTP